jgi:hypothetical protein
MASWPSGTSERRAVRQFVLIMTKTLRGSIVIVFGKCNGLKRGPKEENLWLVSRLTEES